MSLTPYYEDEAVTVFHGDGVELSQQLESVDVFVTDPPYNVRSEDIVCATGTRRRDFGEWDEGWSPLPMLHEAMRLLPCGGSVLAFTSDRLLSAYRQADGWKPRGTIVWEKTNPAPHPRPAYVSATEWIVWLQKPGAGATWNGTGYTPNLLRYPFCGGPERTAHPTQKPEGLMCELIARHTNAGDLILDPFAGSGTTGVAAKRLGRRCILIEQEEKYCEVAAKRLAQGALDLFSQESA